MAEPLEMVECAPQRMRLSRLGCARLWTSAQANPPQPHEGRWHCRHCPIGAGHAGKAVAPAAAAVELLDPICARCERIAHRGDRQHGLVAKWLCVSCDNRQREAERGRNAKGSVPRLAAQLGAAEIMVGDQAATFPGVVGRAEAAILAARRAGRPIVIAVPPLRIDHDGQLLLPVCGPVRSLTLARPRARSQMACIGEMQHRRAAARRAQAALSL